MLENIDLEEGRTNELLTGTYATNKGSSRFSGKRMHETVKSARNREGAAI
jgi:hypothetical protein